MTGQSPTPRVSSPGWPEIVAALVTMAVVGIGGAFLIARLPIGLVALGLILTAWSGIGGMIGFFVAYRLRVRSLPAFGIRPTTRRWLLIAVAVGVLAFVIKGLAVMAYVAFTGQDQNIQRIYAEGAGGDWWSLLLSTFFLSVVTPLGEEFLFRGVVTSALLRYGPLIGVIGSALIFAVFHGINPVFPAALVAGLATAEIFRRSGSIWPPVIVHIVFNLPTIPVMLLAAAAQ